ncbi:hypothetical protein LDC_0881 [sediment metagenome]|uniref:Uncharacterized protein n=1 Tax=sediment metagenome TaxID=749907 RepID=D9PH81_9ZZZZ
MTYFEGCDKGNVCATCGTQCYVIPFLKNGKAFPIYITNHTDPNSDFQKCYFEDNHYVCVHNDMFKQTGDSPDIIVDISRVL